MSNKENLQFPLWNHAKVLVCVRIETMRYQIVNSDGTKVRYQSSAEGKLDSNVVTSQTLSINAARGPPDLSIFFKIDGLEDVLPQNNRKDIAEI